MIRVEVVQADKDMEIQKNGTFIKGKSYFARNSQKGDRYLIKSEEGQWITIYHKHYTYNRNDLTHLFKTERVIFMRNKKALDKYVNPIHYYLYGVNKEVYPSGFQLEDESLWR